MGPKNDNFHPAPEFHLRLVFYKLSFWKDKNIDVEQKHNLR